LFASLARGQMRRRRHLLPRQAARQPDIPPRPRRVWPIPATAVAFQEERASSRAQAYGHPHKPGLAGTLAPLPLSLAWVSQNTDFRTWRWNQYERHAEAFFLGTLRLDLVVTGVPANKPSSFRITRWGGSWLNSSSSIWSLSAWNDTARFT